MPNPKTNPSDLRVKVLPLADLTPYPRNPRHITPAAVNAVAESLAAFGWQQPIVIDPKRVIVAGHTRRLAALQLGWTHAPTVTIPAKHAKAYRLADNRSGEFSTWNLDVLPGELAALPTGQLEALPALDFDAIRPLTGNPRVTHNTGSFEWYTPVEIVEAARACMGGIDLDPASCEVAQATVKATSFYTIEDDGLSKPWAGRVFLNPPYATALIEPFAARLGEHVRGGKVSQAVAITNDSTETKWFHAFLSVSRAICLHKGRVPFWRPEGSDSGPLQGQTIFYAGPNVDRFNEAFGHMGVIAAPLRPAE